MSGYHTNFNVVGKMALAGRRIEQTWDQWYTARLDIHPVKGLSIKGDVSYNSYFRKVKSHGKTFYQVHPEGREPELVGSPNNVTNEHYNNNYLALNLWAEYKHTWNEMHNFSAMAGYNQEGKDYYGNTLTMNGLYDNNLPVTVLQSIIRMTVGPSSLRVRWVGILRGRNLSRTIHPQSTN